MPRLPKHVWADIRAEREAGASFGELASKFNVSKAAIVLRAKREGWSDGRNVEDVIKRKVAEKLNNITPADPVRKMEAIDAAAERKAEIVRRHQEETNAARERLYAGIKAHKAATTREEKLMAFEDLKAAKIASETLANIQRLERINWGLDDNATTKMEIVIERNYGNKA